MVAKRHIGCRRRMAEVIALRRQVDELAAAELPHGFGRD
jgi:hypothetical protein